MRPGQNYAGGWAEQQRPELLTDKRWRWRNKNRSGAFWSGGSPSCRIEAITNQFSNSSSRLSNSEFRKRLFNVITNLQSRAEHVWQPGFSI
jgi:hypothetical protein